MATRVHEALVGVGKGLSVVAGGLAAVQVLDRIASSGRDASVGLEQLDRMMRAGGIGGAFDDLSDEANTLNKSLELLLGDSLNSNMERSGSTLDRAVAGGASTDQVQEAEERFASLGETLAGMVSEGKADEAAARFEEIADAAKALGFETDEVANLMPAYEEALAGVDDANADAAASGEENSEAIAGVGGSAADAQERIETLADMIRDFGAAQNDADRAAIDMQEKMRALNDIMVEGAGSLDIHTEAGSNAQSAMLDVAQSATEWAASVLEAGGEQETGVQRIARLPVHRRVVRVAVHRPVAVIDVGREALENSSALVKIVSRTTPVGLQLTERMGPVSAPSATCPSARAFADSSISVTLSCRMARSASSTFSCAAASSSAAFSAASARSASRSWARSSINASRSSSFWSAMLFQTRPPAVPRTTIAPTIDRIRMERFESRLRFFAGWTSGAGMSSHCEPSQYFFVAGSSALGYQPAGGIVMGRD